MEKDTTPTSSEALVVVDQAGRAETIRLNKMLELAGKSMIASADRLAGHGVRVDPDALAEFKAYVGTRRSNLLAAAKASGYGPVAVANYARFVNDMTNTARLIWGVVPVGQGRDIVGLARLRTVSKPLKLFVDSIVLHEIDYGYYKQPVTYTDVANQLGGYRFAGLHGSSSVHGPSLYRGLKAPDPGQVNYSTSQLGPGFYLTEGDTNVLHTAYARSVADLSRGKSGGSSYLYRVMLRNVGALTSSEVPPEHWNNMVHDIVNPQIAQYDGRDLMRSEIVDNQPARQIKVNSRAFAQVMVMPPRFEGADALEWLKARFRPPE